MTTIEGWRVGYVRGGALLSPMRGAGMQGNLVVPAVWGLSR